MVAGAIELADAPKDTSKPPASRLRPKCLLWVILRKSRIEHIWSGLPLIASVYADFEKSSVSADSVAKLFCASERARLIQDQAHMRNLDSEIHASQFDRFKFVFHSFSAATFATISATSGHYGLVQSLGCSACGRGRGAAARLIGRLRGTCSPDVRHSRCARPGLRFRRLTSLA
jgi:hypothetical protein